MLGFLTHIILGFWFGYLFRRNWKKPVQKMPRIIFLLSTVFLSLVFFVVLFEGRPQLAGVLSTAVGFGAYYGTNLKEEFISRLEITWAGIWLPILYLLAEFLRFSISLNIPV